MQEDKQNEGKLAGHSQYNITKGHNKSKVWNTSENYTINIFLFPVPVLVWRSYFWAIVPADISNEIWLLTTPEERGFEGRVVRLIADGKCLRGLTGAASIIQITRADWAQMRT